MLRATITTSTGQTVVLEGDPAEIGAALSALGAAPSPARRGPGRPPKSAAATNGATTSQAPEVKPRKAASPEVARKRALQGQYMGVLRGLGAADKKRAQAIAKERGVEAGLAEAQRLRAGSAGPQGASAKRPGKNEAPSQARNGTKSALKDGAKSSGTATKGRASARAAARA